MELPLLNRFFIRCHTNEEIELIKQKEGFKAIFLSGLNKGQEIIMSEKQILNLFNFNLAVVYEPSKVSKKPTPAQPTKETVLDDIIYW
jgi:hypothetical protein